MMKLLVLTLAASAMAEDFTDTPFHWPDMLRNGNRVTQILASEKNPRPSADVYPKWYNKNSLRFVEVPPVPPGEEVAGGELVVLEYDDVNAEQMPVKQAAMRHGLMGLSVGADRVKTKQNQLGLIAKAADGKELGRYALSLWPIGNDEIVDKDDHRQKPRIINGALVALNRAVVAVQLSKANAWMGLPKDTKQIHVANLNLKEYDRAMEAIKEFSDQAQYFNDFQVADAMPAVTTDKLLEAVVKAVSSKSVFAEGLAKVGYLNLVEEKTKPLKKPVSASQIKGLMANKKQFDTHYNRDMFIVPAYYDKDGQPRPSMMTDTPDEWYVIWTEKATWLQNYLKAEQLQLRQGVTSATFAQAPDAEAEKPVVKKTSKAKGKKKLNLRIKGKKGKHSSFIEWGTVDPYTHMKVVQTEQAEKTAEAIEQEMEAAEESGEELRKPKIEAWYLNMADNEDRKQCMEVQLREQGFEPHREQGVKWPHGGVKSVSLAAIKAADLGDCVPNGISMRSVSDHMAKAASPEVVRANILSNYCGHKRLIEKLAESESDAEYFLIFEDDAQLKPWFRLHVEDFVKNYKGPWSAVQIDPFFVKSNSVDHASKIKKVPEGLAAEYRNHTIYHGGILSGIQTLLIKRERIGDIVTAMNEFQAIPADHIGRYIPSMIAWKPYIAVHPGWWGEEINEKCSKSVMASRISRQFGTSTANFLAKEGYDLDPEDHRYMSEQIDNNIEENPDDNGPLMVLNNLGIEEAVEV